MNRLFSLCFFLLPFLCSSQNYSLCMQVIASTGGSGAQGNYHVSWTVGESVIKTVSSAANTLTQGFHQPDVCATVATSNLDLEAFSLEVFPNPTSSNLIIRFHDVPQTSLQVQVFDVLGSTVLQPTALVAPEGTILDTTNWQPGLYFVQIQEKQSKASTTISVVRL